MTDTKIYIDVLVLTNAVITLCYLRCAAAVCRERLKGSRLAAASVIGGVGSLLAIPQSSSFAGALMLTLAKAGVILAVTAAAFGKKTPAEMLGRAAVYLLCDILMGGVCLALVTLTRRRILTVRNYVVYFDISLWQMAVGCAAVYLIITAAGAVRIRHSASAGYRVSYALGGYSRDFPAIADTGNRLTDSFTGEPVVIFRSDDLWRRYSLDRPELMAAYGFRPVPFETISGEGVVYVTSRGSVTVTDAGRSFEAACCAGILPSGGKEYAIFNPELLSR
ncbi:MAG: sigma-E processing peptidase SpoIIGA [Ruminococcus sp.]|nr:sigma-E processing peptidase SpoIIGA [Ruminococcus sp.]